MIRPSGQEKPDDSSLRRGREMRYLIFALAALLITASVMALTVKLFAWIEPLWN